MNIVLCCPDDSLPPTYLVNQQFCHRSMSATYFMNISIQGVPGGKVNILGGYSIGHSKQKLYMNMCPIPKGFRNRTIWMRTAKLLIRKRYYEYVVFLITVFIVQVTELVQFIINVRKFHRFTCFRQWRSRAGGKDITGRPSQTTIQSNGSISETVRNRTHGHIKFFLFRMTNTMTSQNIGLSSWDTLYIAIKLLQTFLIILFFVCELSVILIESFFSHAFCGCSVVQIFEAMFTTSS